ncbi:MAG: exodeoxyribonuclease VII small subunit [Tetrasphaera sp.]
MSAAPEPDQIPPGTEADSATPDPGDVSTLGYEHARDELVAIVARLEGGRVGLEESMTLWQRAEALAARCTEWLDAAEAAVPPTPTS